MRTFDDTQGGHWQAALMEGSYGSVELIFGRIGGDGEVLHWALDAEAVNMTDATQLVADQDEAGLCAWLAEATPWP